MLGSQIIDVNPRIAGSDLSIPEVRIFGYCKFRSAVRTNDDWGTHTGAEIVFLISGEACWEGEDECLIQAAGGQAVVFPKGYRHRIINSVYPPSESLWIIMKDAEDTDGPSLLTRRAHKDFCDFLNQGNHLWDVGPACAAHVMDLSRLLVDPAIYSGNELVISELRARLHCVLLEFWKNCSERAPARREQRPGLRRQIAAGGEFRSGHQHLRDGVQARLQPRPSPRRLPQGDGHVAQRLFAAPAHQALLRAAARLQRF